MLPTSFDKLVNPFVNKSCTTKANKANPMANSSKPERFLIFDKTAIFN